jgi:hypothetical protein
MKHAGLAFYVSCAQLNRGLALLGINLRTAQVLRAYVRAAVLAYARA